MQGWKFYTNGLAFLSVAFNKENDGSTPWTIKSTDNNTASFKARSAVANSTPFYGLDAYACTSETFDASDYAVNDSVATMTVTKQMSSSGNRVILTASVTNSGNDTMNITCVKFTTLQYVYYSGGATAEKTFLSYAYFLENAITVNPAETKNITISIEMNNAE